ncbi:OAS [Mytilus coruscus]|uniref:OAS n=1 Tax=Mytilus coruscus TaxID=42192 RepID=A0A6J8ARK4_MYTCO|nr:OAS [Mytilus coruscus]
MSQLVFDLVRKFSWEYRRANLAEFPFVCNICGPEERRFRKEKDQQKHDEMTKRHDPNFVPHTMAIGSGSIDFIRNERDLEVFIRDHVETDDAYRSVCKGVIRNVGDILKNNIKGKYRPDEVLKTGSTAKGTAIKGKTEYQSIDQFYNDLPIILGDINDALNTCPQFKNVRVQKRAVSFQTDCREPGTGHAHVIDVDILPAVNFGDDISIIFCTLTTNHLSLESGRRS